MKRPSALLTEPTISENSSDSTDDDEEEDDDDDDDDGSADAEPKKSKHVDTPSKKPHVRVGTPCKKLEKLVDKKLVDTPRKKPKKTDSAEKKRFSKPKFSIEWSRNQIMCRSGLRGPGESQKIRWGSGEECANMKSAQKLANKWLKDNPPLL